MKEYGLFDILGPIMIGPSSSHTAGAARLGKIARDIVQMPFNKVEFLLHGSFAKTYEGHGTDKALVGGVLGMDPDDENIRDAFSIAEEKGLAFTFIETDLGYEHPNTVKIIFHPIDSAAAVYITGSSVGGGNILITDINGNKVEFTGDYPTLLLRYLDRKGVISQVTTLLTTNEINIATMKVIRERNIATMLIETDSDIENDLVDEITSIDKVFYIKALNPIRR